ncbi:hypothetical protein EV363DRAFT_1392223 [Boletus edulis]|nr:hypothetical protein EV363DRAFT_1392223 [Boletus edulis]
MLNFIVLFFGLLAQFGKRAVFMWRCRSSTLPTVVIPLSPTFQTTDNCHQASIKSSVSFRIRPSVVRGPSILIRVYPCLSVSIRFRIVDRILCSPHGSLPFFHLSSSIRPRDEYDSSGTALRSYIAPDRSGSLRVVTRCREGGFLLITIALTIA